MKRPILFLALSSLCLFYVLHNSPDTKERNAPAKGKDTVVVLDTVFMQIPNPVNQRMSEKDSAPANNSKEFSLIPDKVASSSERVFKIINCSEFAFQPDTILLQKQGIFQQSGEFRSFAGSGFVINNNLIVTAAHIVNIPECFLPQRWGYKTIVKTRQLRVYLTDDYFVEATVDTIDAKNDVAILSLGEQARLPSLSLRAGNLKKFEPLWTAGYPDGDNGIAVTPAQIFYAIQNSSTAFSSGQTRDLIDSGHEKVMRLSGGGDHGISGGPILDQNGNVVGIIVQLNDRGTTAYGTPAEFIERLLKKK